MTWEHWALIYITIGWVLAMYILLSESDAGSREDGILSLAMLLAYPITFIIVVAAEIHEYREDKVERWYNNSPATIYSPDPPMTRNDIIFANLAAKDLTRAQLKYVRKAEDLDAPSPLWCNARDFVIKRELRYRWTLRYWWKKITHAG